MGDEEDNSEGQRATVSSEAMRKYQERHIQNIKEHQQQMQKQFSVDPAAMQAAIRRNIHNSVIGSAAQGTRAIGNPTVWGSSGATTSTQLGDVRSYMAKFVCVKFTQKKNGARLRVMAKLFGAQGSTYITDESLVFEFDSEDDIDAFLEAVKRAKDATPSKVRDGGRL